MDRAGNAASDEGRSRKGKTVAASMAIGWLTGVIATGVVGWMAMPGMMIVTDRSHLSFDETVAALGKAITDQGWISSGTTDMQASLAEHGQDFPHRVKIIKLCRPQYAADVLRTDRQVSSLMPCSIAVWEGDDGSVNVSKMNTELMGRMFGGNIAAVMGSKVAHDEAAIMAAVFEGQGKSGP